MLYIQNLNKESGQFHASYSLQRNKDNTVTLAGINPQLKAGDEVRTREFNTNYALEVCEVKHCQSGSKEFNLDPQFQNAYFTATCAIKYILQ